MTRFRLADVERENADDQFEVEGSNGKVFTLPHPKAVHADDILGLDLGNLPAVFETLLGDDFDLFISDPQMDGFALEQTFEAYAKHYGLPLPGEADASPRSSSGTARRSKPTSRSSSATRKR
jgi:hypothetical protein